MTMPDVELKNLVAEERRLRDEVVKMTPREWGLVEVERRRAEEAEAELRRLRAERDEARERLATDLEEQRAANKLMSTQFRIMQREKEHGWREANRYEARAEKAEAERDEALDRLARVRDLLYEGRHAEVARRVLRLIDESGFDE
jgi:hypothetical protein